ncbi:hypothetical protein Acidovoranil_06040 [Acidovorax sp. FG27]
MATFMNWRQAAIESEGACRDESGAPEELSAATGKGAAAVAVEGMRSDLSQAEALG